MPVVANGDINSPEKARDVLAYTGADAIMVGRAAQGEPWIFREIAHFLAAPASIWLPPGGRVASSAARTFARSLQPVWRGSRRAQRPASILRGICELCRAGKEFRKHINTIEDCAVQWQAVADYLDALGQQMERIPAATAAAEPSSELDEPAEMAA